jgi:hypothetical protein
LRIKGLNLMKYKLPIVYVMATGLSFILAVGASSQEVKGGRINWVDGFVHASGEATTQPSGNKVKDRLRSLRAATLIAQRTLMETVKGLRIDSQTKVEAMMLKEDTVNTRMEGIITSSEIVRQNVEWQGDVPLATVEVRICLNEVSGCNPGRSIISALGLDQRDEPAHVPRDRLDDTNVKQVPPGSKIQGIVYDSSKLVTGLVLNLQGFFFEREVLPVVITTGEADKRMTVYSAKSVEPRVIRTYGVVRFADSVERAKQNDYLGRNILVIPASRVTKDNMIVIEPSAARTIWETTRHGNDYLKEARVIIASK